MKNKFARDELEFEDENFIDNDYYGEFLDDFNRSKKFERNRKTIFPEEF